jgi:outer membrane protein assembly factor BamB
MMHMSASSFFGPSTPMGKWTLQEIGTTSSPTIGSDNTIYLGVGEYLLAINPDGTTKWAFATKDRITSSAAVSPDGTIYVDAGSSLFAVNPNGTEKWVLQRGAAIDSSPAIGADGTIYVGDSDCCLYAVHPDGNVEWAFRTRGSVDTSPAIAVDGTVYAASSDGGLYAINPDGTRKWVFTTDLQGATALSSPAIGPDGTIYADYGGTFLYAIDAKGTPQWVLRTGDTSTTFTGDSSPAIGHDGTIYATSSDDHLYAVSPDGMKLWTFPVGGPVNSSPAIDLDGTVYLGSSDDNLYAVNPDGTERWAFPTASAVGSSPAIGSDGTIYAGSQDGSLFAIGPGPAGHPSVVITSPTLSATWTTSARSLSVLGNASAVTGLNIVSVTWWNDQGASGKCAGTTSWSASGIALQPGSNVVSVKAVDSALNERTATLTVTVCPPKQIQAAAPTAPSIYESPSDELLSFRRTQPRPLVGRRNFTFGNVVYDPAANIWRGFWHYITDNQIYESTSTDGKNFTDPVLCLALASSGSWDDKQLGVPFAWYEAGQTRPWRMLYRGISSSDDQARIGLATSIDGVSWAREDPSGNALTSYVLDSDGDFGVCIRSNSVYYIYYNYLGGARAINVATSPDLVNWTKDTADNPIFQGTVDSDPPGAEPDTHHGRFCPDVVRWDTPNGTVRYVAYVVHYEGTSALPAIEVYTCPNPVFRRTQRTYVGRMFITDITPPNVLRGRTINDSGCDTPRMITNDITRNVTNGCIYTGNELRSVVSIFVGYGSSWYDEMFVHDRTLGYRLDADGTIYGWQASNVLADWPVSTPQYQLSPAGTDANSQFLFLPGATGSLLDWGPLGLHMDKPMSSPPAGIDSNGLECSNTNSSYAVRWNTGSLLTDPTYSLAAIRHSFTVEASITFNSAIASGSRVILESGPRLATNYHLCFFVQRSGSAYLIGIAATSGGINRCALINWPMKSLIHGQQYRLAVARDYDSGLVYFFVDGVLLNPGGTAFAWEIDDFSVQRQMCLSIGTNYEHTTAWDGAIDQVQISDICRWTASYTPTAPVVKYTSSGHLFSPVYDLGSANSGKTFAITDSAVPKNTTLTIEARTAGNARNRSYWVGDFASYTAPLTGRYQQFLITMTTSDPTVTPILRAVGFQ